MKKTIKRVIRFFYFPPFSKFIPFDTFAYMAAGGVNMLLNSALYYCFYHFVFGEQDLDLGFLVFSPHVASFIAVFPITLLTGFWLMDKVVFEGAPRRKSMKMTIYSAVVVANIFINIFGIKFLVECLHVFPTVSNFIMTVFCALLSYLIQTKFTFKNYNKTPD